MPFWDLLKPTPAAKGKAAPKPPTAAELEAALAEAEAAARAAEAAAGEVAERRAGMLLTADDAELDADRSRNCSSRNARRTGRHGGGDAAHQARFGARGRAPGRSRCRLQQGRTLLRSGVELYAQYDVLARAAAELVEQISRHRRRDPGRQPRNWPRWATRA